MAFSTLTGNGWALIDAWAAAMIATGSWEDADTSLKADGTTDPAGRVLRYTRAGEELYVCMVHAYIGNPTNGGASHDYFGAEAVLVFISSGWNNTSHIPSGTVNTTYIPIGYKVDWGAWPAGTPSAPTGSAQWWISANADIWAVLGIGAASAMYNSISFVTFEREDAKEYDDGGSKVFIYADAYQTRFSYNSSYDVALSWGINPFKWSLPSAWSGLLSGADFRKYIHPFTAEYPTGGVDQSNYNYIDGQDQNSSYLIVPTRARKSAGNSKIYMAFPTAFADPGTWRSPIKTLKAWFPVEPGAGVADGDLISIPVSWNGAAAVTWRYIYKALTSPDGGQIDVAVFYDVPTP